MENERTLWCGNLAKDVTEDLIYELFIQTAPLERVKLVEDTRNPYNYAFITMKHQCSVSYVMHLLNGISLYDKSINIRYNHKPCSIPIWNICESYKFHDEDGSDLYMMENTAHKRNPNSSDISNHSRHRERTEGRSESRRHHSEYQMNTHRHGHSNRNKSRRYGPY